MKRIIAIFAALLMLAAVLTACGKENQDATPDSATAESAATQAVEPEKLKLIETTENGTVEEDKEGNILTIDKDKEIVSIKDKDGNAVSVRDYVTTHYVISSDGTTYGEPSNVSGSSGSTSSKSSGSSKADTGSSKSSGSSSKADDSSSKASSQSASSKPSPASSSPEEKPDNPSSQEGIEEEIPTVIVEIPDNMDEYELPIL